MADLPSHVFPLTFSSKLNMEKMFKSAPFINNYKCVLCTEYVLFSVKETLEALKVERPSR